MAIEVFNRYEKKYMLNAIQYEKLTQAISEYMVVDAYNRDKPFYEICNIYYDTPDNALIRASIEGPVYKEKLRMRSYGTPKGLKLIEVYPGIDVQKEILDLLPFEVEV